MKNSKVLMLGSGFYSQAISNSKRDFDDNILINWSNLLLEFKGVNELLRLNSPTIAFEEIILNTKGKSASAIESYLKTEICKSIKEAEQELFKDEHIESFIKETINTLTTKYSYVFDLNFTAFSETDFVKSEIDSNHLKRQESRLYDYFIKNESLVWKPHGHVLNSDTIKLGVRDYGLTNYMYSKIFSEFKEWEKKYSYEEVRAIIKSEDGKLLKREPIDKRYNNWLTRFMLFEVDIVGVGLSTDEVDLWWLLTQRARNTKNIKNPTSVNYHTVRSVETTVRDESLRALNVKVIYYNNFNEMWKQLKLKNDE